MLTDAALTHLKPKEKAYKVSDRDGMYVRVGTNGTISFRLDYRLNGRRETVTFGKCGPSDLSLARAREKRSEEHTSELQSLMRISYAVFCLKKKKKHTRRTKDNTETTSTRKTIQTKHASLRSSDQCTEHN